jgi:hypothetical protein
VDSRVNYLLLATARWGRSCGDRDPIVSICRRRWRDLGTDLLGVSWALPHQLPTSAAVIFGRISDLGSG